MKFDTEDPSLVILMFAGKNDLMSMTKYTNGGVIIN